MYEQVPDKHRDLIEWIVNRDSDPDVGARKALRDKLKQLSLEELERRWRKGK